MGMDTYNMTDSDEDERMPKYGYQSFRHSGYVQSIIFFSLFINQAMPILISGLFVLLCSILTCMYAIHFIDVCVDMSLSHENAG